MLYEHMNVFEGLSEEWAQCSFSQFGEDVSVWGCLEGLGLLTPGGFFVDVGAHHPRRGSNTYLLRKILGWTGVNIEPDPHLFKQFEVECADCINLQMAIGGAEGTAELAIFNRSEVNTISTVQRDRQVGTNVFSIVETVCVPVRRLDKVLDDHMPASVDFRFLTIDAEGVDFEVIAALDFDRYRPKVIAIEDFEMDLMRPEGSAIFGLLAKNRYILESHCRVTSIYRLAA